MRSGLTAVASRSAEGAEEQDDAAASDSRRRRRTTRRGFAPSPDGVRLHSSLDLLVTHETLVRPCAAVKGESVVDEELRAPSEEVRQRSTPIIGLESISLVDPDPRQVLPPSRHLIATPREILIRLEQFEPRCEPLFTCSGPVLRHCSCLLP